LKSKTELLDLQKSDEWQTMSLSEAGVTLIDCLHSTPTASDDGFPYIAIPQIKENAIDFTTARRINQEDFIKWTEKALPQKYDVILSRRCNPGVTAYVPSGTQFAIGQNLVLLRSNGGKIYPPFLRWLVRGKEWWNQIDKFLNVGAIFDSLRCGDVPNFTLTIPSLQEQHKISSVLSTLETKIQNLQNQNKILEQITQIIFKSWFVDFDGITEFDDSELGQIPKGWEVVNLEDLTSLRNGKIFQRSNLLENGSYPVYGSNGITGYTEKYLNESPVIVIGRVGVNCGSLYRIDEPSWTTDNSIIIEPNDLNNFDYVYYSLNQMNLREGIRGSAQPLIVQSELRKMKILQPTEVKLSTFSNNISFISKHIFMNKKNISILTKTRDILLPKLMSGEIRV